MSGIKIKLRSELALEQDSFSVPEYGNARVGVRAIIRDRVRVRVVVRVGLPEIDAAQPVCFGSHFESVSAGWTLYDEG